MRTDLPFGLTPAEATNLRSTLAALLQESFGTPPAYLGPVAAGGTIIPTAISTTNKQIYSRTRYVSRDTISALKIVVPTYYVASTSAPTDGTERACNGGVAVATVHASVEYPAGVITPILWGGASAGTVAANANGVSDFVSVAIPVNTEFWIRLHYANADGIVFASQYPFTSGDQVAFGVTTPDLTLGGSAADTTSNMYTAVAVLGMTRKPTVFLAGDSRVCGRIDTGDKSCNFGALARSVGVGLAYINAGCTGDRALWAKANYTRRAALAAYCTHVICEYGINDLNASNQTSAQTTASLATFFALTGIAGKPIWQCTVPPITTSSDSWATVANQTVNADDADRVTFNNAVRAGIAGVQGFFDLADVAESARDSGKWKAPGWTTDGAHETRLGNLAYQASGIIVPGQFVR